MKLSLKTVEHVARLARLRLTEAERDRMAEALSAVLAHMESLGGANPGGAVLEGERVTAYADLRTDLPRPCADSAGLLELAPQSRGGQFVVPRIVAEP